MNSNIDKKLIARNTLVLYFRMFFVMAVSIFTTRIVLKNLGEQDYGIYNVVAGFVSMLVFLNSSMASATQRFLTFEIGKQDTAGLENIFCQAMSIHILIALIFVLFAETVGLWFVCNQLNIPLERFNAAIWVYQFAILSFVLSILTVPFNASIIAHEQMSIYAAVSIIDVVLKLIIAYAITVISFDKLVTYSVLMFIAAFVPSFVYWLYCRLKFTECHYHFYFDKTKFTEIFSFAGWNIIGNFAYVLRNQGSNILLNIFFGPAVNAARGVSAQVESAVSSFVANFQTASNPQIIKSYAVGAYKESMTLVCQCSKFSFYLILTISIPIIFQAEYVLNLWLGTVPKYTVIFVQVMLINATLDSISSPLKTQAKATGNIKTYMIVQGGFFLLALPVIYIFLKIGFNPVSSVIVLLIFTFLGIFLRLFLVKRITSGFSVIEYLEVLKAGLIVSLVCGLLCYGIGLLFPTNSLLTFGLKTILIVFATLFTVYTLGINKTERNIVQRKFKEYINKWNQKKQ